jgi:hypothetical protein
VVGGWWFSFGVAAFGEHETLAGCGCGTSTFERSACTQTSPNSYLYTSFWYVNTLVIDAIQLRTPNPDLVIIFILVFGM